MWYIYFTHVYTHGLMPRVSFAFAQAAHIRVLFNLWVISTVAIGPRYLNTLATYIGPIYIYAYT